MNTGHPASSGLEDKFINHPFSPPLLFSTTQVRTQKTPEPWQSVGRVRSLGIGDQDVGALRKGETLNLDNRLEVGTDTNSIIPNICGTLTCARDCSKHMPDFLGAQRG